MKYETFTGEVTMRADNHQLVQLMFISTSRPASRVRSST